MDRPVTVTLSENLRLLCSRYDSISQVCQRIGISRQQFTKYLSGRGRPSLHSLSRICDFFGVDEAEILLPHEVFKATVFSRPSVSYVPMGLAGEFRAKRHMLAASLAQLKRYCGVYYIYYRSPAWRKGVVRALMVIWQDAEMTYAKSLDRLYWRGQSDFGRSVVKIRSCLWMDNDRIYILDTQSRRREGYSFMIVNPPQRDDFHYLHGLLMGVTSTGTNMIFCSRLVMEYLGPKADYRTALRECAVLPSDGAEINPMIIQALEGDKPQDRALMTGFHG